MALYAVRVLLRIALTVVLRDVFFYSLVLPRFSYSFQLMIQVLFFAIFKFMQAPGALMNVVTEKGLKMVLTVSRSRVNLLFFLFWTSVYQFLVAVCLFWADFLPQFGYADNIYHFWDK